MPYTPPPWTLTASWQKKDAEGRWYTDPELVVTVVDQQRERDEILAVAVELRYDEDGPYVTGIAVRRHHSAGYMGERTHVAPREVQRLPLAKMVSAALAFASTAEKPPPLALLPEEIAAGRTVPPRPFDPRVEVEVTYYLGSEPPEERGFSPDPQPLVEARKILLPRGRPKRGKSVEFYRDLAKSYRSFELAGLSPVKEIARRKRVSENTVHQWVHRMRHELHFLEPSPRSKRREKNDG